MTAATRLHRSACSRLLLPCDCGGVTSKARKGAHTTGQTDLDRLDIAHAMLYLAGKGANYVTGQTIIADGGALLPENGTLMM